MGKAPLSSDYGAALFDFGEMTSPGTQSCCEIRWKVLRAGGEMGSQLLKAEQGECSRLHREELGRGHRHCPWLGPEDGENRGLMWKG